MDAEELLAQNIKSLPDLLVMHTQTLVDGIELMEAEPSLVEGLSARDERRLAFMFGYSAALELNIEAGGFDSPVASAIAMAVIDAAKLSLEMTRAMKVQEN
jgi:hypothetical protein